MGYTQRKCCFQLKEKWLSLKETYFPLKQFWPPRVNLESTLRKNSFLSSEDPLPVRENTAFIQKRMCFYSKEKLPLC